MKMNSFFEKFLSLILAGCVVFTSIVSLNGCKNSEVNSQNVKVPGVINNYQMLLNDELICNLQNVINNESDKNYLKSGIAKTIETNVGTIDWADNQFVLYDNGIQGLFVPIKRNNIIEGFLVSNPLNNFASIIIKVVSKQKKTDNFFTGVIQFFDLNCNEICAYI
jgi:hypothetical protein